jgi:16S rRNA (guanine527-N7)-methyltransferase
VKSPAGESSSSPTERTQLSALDDPQRRVLAGVLEDAQGRGFLGPGPVEKHIDRALEFTTCVTEPPGRALDLGSGAGLPGLPLALLWPRTNLVLLDGSVTRTGFLTEAVARLGLSGRVSVVSERAEVAGHGPLRSAFELVVARSFGAPAVTAECAAGFLEVGGRLVVAEPPGGDPGRWVSSGLSVLGLRAVRTIVEPSAFQVLDPPPPCPTRYPRRTGVPAKRPLF